MKNTTTKKLLGGVVLALAASGAHAVTISGGSFANPEEVTEINQSGVLDLFDSTLGALISATLTLDGYATSEITLTNNAQQAQLVSAVGSVALFFTESGIGDLGIPDPALTLNLDYTGGFVSLAAGAVQSFGPVQDVQQTVIFKDAGASIFAQAGGGQFQLDCTSISGLNLQGGGGNVDSSQTTTAGCGASIEYDYQPRVTVPSPAPLTLISLGLIGIAGLRRLKA